MLITGNFKPFHYNPHLARASRSSVLLYNKCFVLQDDLIGMVSGLKPALVA